ncbi:hypothetical protein TNCV_1350241 [Trichonephila clavipes]|nr:hypothetical protein TNCV_1350241 [Trichonephila clavipes]
MIHSTRKLSSTYLWSSLNVYELTIDVVGNDAWSTKGEWNVCFTAPYRTMSAELYIPKDFHINLHRNELSTKSDADFILPSDTISDVLFVKMCGRSTVRRLLLVSPLFIHFA